MSTLRRYALAVLLAATAFGVAGALYPHLPAVIPVHFNWQGSPDGFMSRAQGAFVLPAVSVLLLVVLIALEPKSRSGAGQRQAAWTSGSAGRIYPQVVAAIQALQLYLTVVLLMVARGAQIDVRACTFAGVGVLLIFIGNSFGKLPRNTIIGIRTMWTLSSDEVWSRTHRVGGWLFVLAGLATTACALLGYPRAGLVAILAASLVSVMYAGHVGRRLGGGHGSGGR